MNTGYGLTAFNKNYEILTPQSPIEWLSYLKNADAVFTDSYHGLLFSLYFRVPFWTSNYGNRIESILSLLGLENRKIKNDENLKSIIDFNSVENKIESLRNDSIRYITNRIIR
jgi:hypothetical protein